MHILEVSDYWTRWTEAYAIPDQTAETVANKIVTEFICRFGVCLDLHSDQGRNFESTLVSQVCELLEINKTRTAPFRPCSDGLVERFNRTLQAILSTVVSENHKD